MDIMIFTIIVIFHYSTKCQYHLSLYTSHTYTCTITNAVDNGPLGIGEEHCNKGTFGLQFSRIKFLLTINFSSQKFYAVAS